MHLGREYPFHPEYWATECCFWPAFVPWKMIFEGFGPYPGAWSVLENPLGVVSDAGLVTTDRKTISWHASLPSSTPATDLELSLALATYAGEKYGRFQWRLYNNLVDIAFAYYWQAFPIVLFNCGGYAAWLFDQPIQPNPPPYPFALSMCPARYDEGGSPYPEA
jgi:hypothetical protein